ncbi:MAG: cytochrome c peroxidase [Polyangia bacterium]
MTAPTIHRRIKRPRSDSGSSITTSGCRKTGISSCNSCHDLAKYGVDGAKFSSGHKKQLGGRNAPTVYNAAGHVAQFWDGRAKDVEEQAGGPMINPVEMALPDHKRAETVLQSIPGYVEAFKKAFPGDKQPVTIKNATAAIGAFERRLLTPSRFDKFLGGEVNALNDVEKAGLLKFLDVGCVACHSGTLLGGTAYQKLGAVKPWPNQADLGRAALTKNDADKFLFKVPSLRNVEKTAPYFHDGSADKLADAIKKMAAHQLGRDLSDADAQSIAEFLGSLTGDIPKEYIAEPQLPPSGKTTPKPDPA